MAWRVSGQFIESCSCNMMCPCWLGVPELAVNDQGWCATAAAIRIREGRSDGVDLGGRTAVISFDFPGNIFQGGGTARLYLEQTASPEQRRELEAILSGQRGGPMGILAGLISTWLPAKTADIQVREDGANITVAVDGIGEVQSRPMRDEAGRPTTMQNAGMANALLMETVELAPSASTWADPEMPRRFETRSGGVGNVTWTG